MNEKLIHKESQCQRVLKILENANGQYVDGMIFYNLDHPITQAGARMFELKEMGYKIESRFIEGKNWKEYKLINKNTLW